MTSLGNKIHAIYRTAADIDKEFANLKNNHDNLKKHIEKEYGNFGGIDKSNKLKHNRCKICN